MKKLLLIGLVFSSIYACSPVIKLVGTKTGCWYEKSSHKEVCGVAEKYSAVDSTYSMRTYDGWVMKINASEINWKN